MLRSFLDARRLIVVQHGFICLTFLTASPLLQQAVTPHLPYNNIDFASSQMQGYSFGSAASFPETVLILQTAMQLPCIHKYPVTRSSKAEATAVCQANCHVHMGTWQHSKGGIAAARHTAQDFVIMCGNVHACDECVAMYMHVMKRVAMLMCGDAHGSVHGYIATNLYIAPRRSANPEQITQQLPKPSCRLRHCNFHWPEFTIQNGLLSPCKCQWFSDPDAHA
eukprot:1157452-Pelagomonas_calceolata.AAC.4